LNGFGLIRPPMNIMAAEPSELTPPPARPARELEPVATGPDLSLEAIYEEHFPFVWRSLRRLGIDASAADDAVQDVFLVAHRRLAEFEGRSSVKTWLFGVALRVARTYRRSVRRKRSHGIVPEDEAEISTVADTEGPSPLESATRAQAVERLHAILEQLDEERRAVFILAELEQMSAPQIAEAVGTNLNTVYTRLRAARRDFNEAIARYNARDGWRQR
jgi:RNA polymerase sigma-70 factor, ECF subfamily